MTLVLIHGRAQETFDPHALQTKWVAAIQKGLRSANRSDELPKVLFPYYARTLAPRPEDSLRSAAISQFEREFHIEAVTERAREAPVIPPIAVTPIPTAVGAAPTAATNPDDIIRDGSGTRHAAATRSEDDELRGALNWPITLSFARFLDERWKALAHATVDGILRDVGTYLNDAAVQSRVDEIVRADIERANDPLVIVAHSLGSAVVFRVLHQLAGAKSVRHLITFGCPLGVRAVISRLNVPLAWPPGVQRWTNCSDRRDLVALQASLDRDSLFTGARDGAERADVENFTDIRNFTDNHHGVEGYLEDPLIASRIFEGL